MSYWNRTLTETAYRTEEIVYVHQIKGQRTAQWHVELRFPLNLSLRVSTEPHGMAMPAVFAGRNQDSLKPIEDSNFPSSLLPAVKAISLETAKKEHATAVARGKAPQTSTRVEYYENLGYRLTPAQAAEADRLTGIVGSPFLSEENLASITSRIASTTVPHDRHLEIVARLESDLAETTRKLIKLEKQHAEVVTAQSDAPEALADIESVVERLKINDLTGAYGHTVLEQILDLLEPAVENLADHYC